MSLLSTIALMHSVFRYPWNYRLLTSENIGEHPQRVKGGFEEYLKENTVRKEAEKGGVRYEWEAREEDDQIPFNNVWCEKERGLDRDRYDDGEKDMGLFRMIEETRKDLNTMNLYSEPITAKENIFAKKEAEYDPDVIPKKFCLRPLDKPEIPRAGVNSLSIFDHVKSVKIDCRKFIL